MPPSKALSVDGCRRLKYYFSQLVAPLLYLKLSLSPLLVLMASTPVPARHNNKLYLVGLLMVVGNIPLLGVESFIRGEMWCGWNE
jgi:hypothetical protein